MKDPLLLQQVTSSQANIFISMFSCARWFHLPIFLTLFVYLCLSLARSHLVLPLDPGASSRASLYIKVLEEKDDK